MEHTSMEPIETIDAQQGDKGTMSMKSPQSASDMSEQLPFQQLEFTGRQLGTLRTVDETGQYILIPQPSNSPNDPLNWPYWFKQVIAAQACAAVLCCNLTGAGPSISVVQQAMTWFGAPTNGHISKTAYLLTGTALANGVGLFFWVPAMTKWGRRPAYLSAFFVYFLCLIWVAWAQSFKAELVGRIVLGLASGAGECLGALTMTDVFFVHERGTMMAWYNVLLSCGAALGLIIDGSITYHLTWRYMYYVDIAIVGACGLGLFFFLPETAFNRNQYILSQQGVGAHTSDKMEDKPELLHGGAAEPKKTYAQTLRIFSGQTFTEETYFQMLVRPLGVVWLPAVLYSMLVFAVTIGFLVAVTSNVSPAYSATFGWNVQSTGFLFFGAIVGSLIGIPFGGQAGDWVSNWMAKRNGGVREPEYRLLAMVVPVITGPLSLILYGLCIERKTNWFVGCLGLSLVNFTICAGTNISLVYSIDVYKPIADEVVTATLAGKAIVGFILSFYTNPWINQQGYLPAYGEMAAISFGILSLSLPMYIWGKWLRQSSMDWRLLKWASQWHDDRDDIKVN